MQNLEQEWAELSAKSPMPLGPLNPPTVSEDDMKQIIAMLEPEGYYVENMFAEHGPEFEGQWRWMNDRLDAFQDAYTSHSPENAWFEALQHHWAQLRERAA